MKPMSLLDRSVTCLWFAHLLIVGMSGMSAVRHRIREGGGCFRCYIGIGPCFSLKTLFITLIFY